MKLASFTLKILIQRCKRRNRTKTDMLKQGSAETMSKSTREDQQKQQRAVTPGEIAWDCAAWGTGERRIRGKSTAQRLGDLWDITTYK